MRHNIIEKLQQYALRCKLFVSSLVDETIFTLLYSAISTYLVLQFVRTEEGRANFVETLSLGVTREALFLLTVFTLIKFLNNWNTNLKEQIFKNEYTTTYFIIALIAGSAWMLR